MGEIKAGIFSMAIFALFIFPILLFIGVESIQQHSFMKHTTEMSEIVRQEGGVTERVRTVKAKMEQRGYKVEIKSDGQTINGPVGYGKSIDIVYRYSYDSPLNAWSLAKDNTGKYKPTKKEKRVLTTMNTVFNMRR